MRAQIGEQKRLVGSIRVASPGCRKEARDIAHALSIGTSFGPAHFGMNENQHWTRCLVALPDIGGAVVESGGGNIGSSGSDLGGVVKNEAGSTAEPAPPLTGIATF